MRVKDIMTANVIAVTEETTLLAALRTLIERKVSALVVLDAQGAPVGVLSEGDLLRRAELGTQKRRTGWLEFLAGGGRSAKDYVLSHGRRVGELMTRGALSIDEDAEIAAAVDIISTRKVKRLVVTRGHVAVGVLSRSDILKALLATLEAVEAERTDAEIFNDIVAQMSRESWTPRGSIHADVTRGIVTLEGAISDERLRSGLKVLVENVPGVKAVKDRLAWIEPNSGYLVPSSED
jgi:CBS domain-containing protein